MKTLVIGASGLVGGALMRSIGEAAVGTFRSRPSTSLRYLDASDPAAVAQLISEVAAEVVYFPAANPNVDWCETNPEAAFSANVVPALAALKATRARGAKFVFFSSDYVFDGSAGPYAENDAVAPLSVYGRHKRDVEVRVLESGGTVIRTTTVFGQEMAPAKNFVLRAVQRLRDGLEVVVPSDQLSTPTWSEELARAAIAIEGRPGVWHVAGPDYLSRDKFAILIAEVFGLDASLIRPVRTADLSQSARRPLRAGLKIEKLRGQLRVEPLTTRDALVRLMMPV